MGDFSASHVWWHLEATQHVPWYSHDMPMMKYYIHIKSHQTILNHYDTHQFLFQDPNIENILHRYSDILHILHILLILHPPKKPRYSTQPVRQERGLAEWYTKRLERALDLLGLQHSRWTRMSKRMETCRGVRRPGTPYTRPGYLLHSHGIDGP